MATEIRRQSIAMINRAGSGHPGGCLSSADVISHLYFDELRVRPDDPEWPDRDRFVLSKGHSCPALYAALSLRGFFVPEVLRSFRQIGGRLQGEPELGTVPGIDATSGSLGQGFSIALGMALGLRLRGSRARTVVMLGDGELQEGQVWEAAMAAAHHSLRRLCAVVDYNKLQSDDLNANIMGLEPLAAKWKAFGWSVREIDGHDSDEIRAGFAWAWRTPRPSVLIAHTIKGRGVGFMEGMPAWHGSVRMREEDTVAALRDLGADPEDMTRYIGDEAK